MYADLTLVSLRCRTCSTTYVALDFMINGGVDGGAGGCLVAAWCCDHAKQRDPDRYGYRPDTGA